MGKIASGNVALEHIIPESFNSCQDPEEEFAYYAGYAPVLSDNVELSDKFSEHDFNTKEEIKDISKYPHLISYVNIVASCHGIIDKKDGTSCFCNHPRGNKRIIPLMLMESTPQTVSYNQLGIIHIDLSSIAEKKETERAEETGKTIDALQLNNDTLQEIRVLWYKISRTPKTIDEIVSITHPKDRIGLLKEIFLTDDYTTLEQKWKKYAPIPQSDNTSQSAAYWELFVKYEWFYNYYKEKYP